MTSKIISTEFEILLTIQRPNPRSMKKLNSKNFRALLLGSKASNYNDDQSNDKKKPNDQSETRTVKPKKNNDIPKLKYDVDLKVKYMKLKGETGSIKSNDQGKTRTVKPKKFNEIPKLKNAVDLKVKSIKLKVDTEPKKFIRNKVHDKADEEDDGGDSFEDGDHEEEGEYGEEGENDENDEKGDEQDDIEHQGKMKERKLKKYQDHKGHKGKGHKGKKKKHGGKHKGKGKKGKKGDDKTPRYPPLDRDKLYEQGLLIYMRDFK